MRRRTALNAASGGVDVGGVGEGGGGGVVSGGGSGGGGGGGDNGGGDGGVWIFGSISRTF